MNLYPCRGWFLVKLLFTGHHCSVHNCLSDIYRDHHWFSYDILIIKYPRRIFMYAVFGLRVRYKLFDNL